MSAIKLINISKSFNIPTEKQDSLRERFINLKFKQNLKRLPALKDINLEIKTGQWLGVIGANGSGKSTMLKIISGIYEPDTGQVDVKGRLVPFLELGVGFNPELSAKDNIFLNGVILGMNRKDILQKLETIVKFAGVRRFINVPLKNLSTGMQLRLGFAIAIQAQADIYLMDEVLSVGDYQFQQKAKKVFEQMKQQKKTVVMVSHDLNSIVKYCDRVLWLSHGRIKKLGTPKTVISRYAV